VDVAQENVDVEDEVGNLLHHPCHGKVGAKFFRELDVAAAAGLQIAGMRGGIDRGNINDLELAGICQTFAHLIADAHQPLLLVGSRPVHLALQAAVDHLEIEHRKFRRIGARRTHN